ncbi:hypothetical protein BT96DRAFT_991474 [Gymnopus androsaceus JB14]|uniref:Uncharacterized protein n=1 Tax=Gymnopus androsaceus JB14 TaxID=1447944 RepID=A0A6A4HUJ6_9AGAR|nr:hypothetical protein BT96DRAFT_991474 [Gymnopus androsaceus JB14]
MKGINLQLDNPRDPMPHVFLSFSDKPKWSLLSEEIRKSFIIPTDKVAVTYINSGTTFTICTQNTLEAFYKAHYKPGKLIHFFLLKFLVGLPDCYSLPTLPDPHSKPDPKQSIDILSQQAQSVHDKAWGKKWSHCRGQIKSIEIGSPPRDSEFEYPGKIEVPKLLDYDCFIGIHELREALFCLPMVVVIAHGKYKKLRKYLDKALRETIPMPMRAFIITGQPGIGLKNHISLISPFKSEHYFVFDKDGGKVYPCTVLAPGLDQCWALTNSNSDTVFPGPFLSYGSQCVILASSPNSERWKQWMKHASAVCLVSELPEVLEIAAIVKETSGNVSQTLYHVGIVGPLICIVRLIQNLVQSASFENDARKAATKICEKASSLSITRIADTSPQAPSSDGSTILYLRPHHPGGVILGNGQLFIPTQYLWDIFETAWRQLKNRDSLKLFFLLSSHALTQSIAGWNLGMRMHEQMCSSRACIDLIPADDSEPPLSITPSTNLVPGTLAGLNQLTDTFFCWIPLVTNFPGIDGVLGNIEGNMFTVQCMIALEHSAPNEGISKTWWSVPSAIQKGRSWHHVVVLDNQSTAEQLMSMAVKQLQGPPVNKVKMKIWCCSFV